MAPRAFISFEMEDSWARDFLVQQAHDKRNDIEFIDYSVQDAWDKSWKTQCSMRIARTRGTVVLLGPTTYLSRAVKWEVEETIRQEHYMFGIQTSSRTTYPVPKGLPERTPFAGNSRRSSHGLAPGRELHRRARAARIRARLSPNDLPDLDTTNLFRSYAALLLAKGSFVTAEDVHNAWAAWMLSVNEAHEALVPFGELPEKTAETTELYVDAIKSVAGELQLQPQRRIDVPHCFLAACRAARVTRLRPWIYTS